MFNGHFDLWVTFVPSEIIQAGYYIYVLLIILLVTFHL